MLDFFNPQSEICDKGGSKPCQFTNTDVENARKPLRDSREWGRGEKKYRAPSAERRNLKK